MGKTAKDVMNLIKENDIKMVDFKMVDINAQFGSGYSIADTMLILPEFESYYNC